jgi:hypothetical protein
MIALALLLELTADGYLPILLEEDELRAFRVVGVLVKSI